MEVHETQPEAEDAAIRAAACFRKLCLQVFGSAAKYVKWAPDNKTVGYIPNFSHLAESAEMAASLRASLDAIDSWETDGVPLNSEEQIIVLTHFWKQVSNWTWQPEKRPAGKLVNNALVCQPFHRKLLKCKF